MRKWSGIEANSAPRGDAPLFVQNGRFYLEGELQRRRGLTKVGANAGTTLAVHFHAAAGFFIIYAKSDGTIEAVAS